MRLKNLKVGTMRGEARELVDMRREDKDGYPMIRRTGGKVASLED